MRESSYNIYVELPNDPDSVLLIHGYTGAFDTVRRHVADYIRSLRNGGQLQGEYQDGGGRDHVPRPSRETISILQRRGYIVNMNPEEEEAFFVRFVKKMGAYQLLRKPTYVIMLTYGCNLRCPYCFQDEIRRNPRYKKYLVSMTRNMVDNIFSGIHDIEVEHSSENANGTKDRRFVFFGGEPLLRENCDVVKYIIEQASIEWEPRFDAITNATELHAYREILGPTGISSIQVTLDGPPTEHDQRRVYANGQGTFEQIAENISLALDLGVRVRVRVNVDRQNIKDLPALAREIIRRKWNEHELFEAYVAPIHVSLGNEKLDPKQLLSTPALNKTLYELEHRYPEMRIFSRGRANNLKNQLLLLFRDKEIDPLQVMSPTFCGAHKGMYVIDPLGDVYACWDRTSNRDFRIGYIRQGRFIKTANYHLWKGRDVTSNPICRRCPYALFCGGGCAALAEVVSGTIYSNYCDGFHAMFRDVAVQAYVEFIQEQASFQ